MQKYRKRKREEKAIAPLIGTVLLVLITVAAVGIVGSGVMVVIDRGTELGQECLKASLQVDTASGYTCYDENNQELQVMIIRGAEDFNLAAVHIIASGGGVSKKYEISTGGNAYARAIGGMYGGSLTLPGINEGKAYIVNVDREVNKVSIAPIVRLGNKRRVCGVTAKLTSLKKCSQTTPMSFLIYKEQGTDELNNKWGWPITGFAASTSTSEVSSGSYSLAVAGTGSAAFDPNVDITKADYLTFSYKKDDADAYLSVFYHISDLGDNEWIEITDLSARGYRGYDITHEVDTNWHTVTVNLNNLVDAGDCSGYADKGLVDNFEFAVWDATTIYFDDVYFY